MQLGVRIAAAVLHLAVLVGVLLLIATDGVALPVPARAFLAAWSVVLLWCAYAFLSRGPSSRAIEYLTFYRLFFERFPREFQALPPTRRAVIALLGSGFLLFLFVSIAAALVSAV